MSLDTINNGDTGLQARTKINAAIAAAGALPRGYLAGLAIRSIGTRNLYVYAGTCRDDTNSVDMTLGGILIKLVDAPWASGDSSGALDPYSVPALTTHSCYAVWLIMDSSNNVDVILSAYGNSVPLPSGFMYKRRIGWVRADSSTTLVISQQYGDETILNTSQTSADFSTIVSYQTGIALRAPPSVDALVKASASSSSGAFFVTLDASAAPPVTPTAETASLRGVAATAPAAGHFMLPTDAYSYINANAAGTNVTLKLTVRGWRDSRGRFD